MKMIIDIDEETYKSIKHGMKFKDDVEAIMAQIENGIPLPKNHGDLKDMDEIIEKIRKLPNAGVHWFINAESVFNTILDAPTIIEGSDKCGNGI